MRYAGIIYDDTAAAPGLSLTLFTQGCPFHCKGCHNPETWDYNGGYEYTKETEQKIVNALSANGVIRNLCIMGGEPLLPDNIDSLYSLTRAVRDNYKNEIKIYLWTGFTIQELKENTVNEHPQFCIFKFLRNKTKCFQWYVKHISHFFGVDCDVCRKSGNELVVGIVG